MQFLRQVNTLNNIFSRYIYVKHTQKNTHTNTHTHSNSGKNIAIKSTNFEGLWCVKLSHNASSKMDKDFIHFDDIEKYEIVKGFSSKSTIPQPLFEIFLKNDSRVVS